MGELTGIELLHVLANLPPGTGWVAFTEDDSGCSDIARDISALANAAAYPERPAAYKVWGIDGDTHELVGTAFDPLQAKGKGGQPLPIWLSTVLSDNARFDFEQLDYMGKHFQILTVHAASGSPVTFDHVAYLRCGSSSTRLSSSSATSAELWRRLQRIDFEDLVARGDLLARDVDRLLDLEAYYRLLNMPQLKTLERQLESPVLQGLLIHQDNGRYAVTNLGALLIAKRLSAFASLKKRILRVVRHDGDGNLRILEDRFFDCGYALALDDAVRYVMSHTQAQETRDGAFRRVTYAYPEEAVRELISNILIHQDLSDTTAGPCVGMYASRIEFSNPGSPLLPPDRWLNARPKTRNRELVDIMRQMDLCEEDGTGFDLVIDSLEAAHLCAPTIEGDEILGTLVTMRANASYEVMTKREREMCVYWHTCLKYVQKATMDNSSLRRRFGFDDSRKHVVAMSRLIRATVDDGLIRPEDEDAPDRFRRYVPYWA